MPKDVRSPAWLKKHNTAEEAASTLILTDKHGDIVYMGKNVVIPPEATQDLGTATGSALPK